ncbi:hypothetical protein D9615_007061 [Tricholomella constricta]|uniref:V-SNARE coiled-coil homology domain-containing protein n=1 Tax=Tricholomella constricta TaxID=117010 RepID=A0A8H5M2K3_9AGAR|nr:hypothetical protein D9615_007061 [Tricholomella constricta]
MLNYARRSYTPFTLHGTVYDPPTPTVGPAPSAPSAEPASRVMDESNAKVNSNPRSNGTGRPARNGRTSVGAVQAEIDETVAIMRGNLQSLAERGEHIESLQSRTGVISSIFYALLHSKSAHKVRKVSLLLVLMSRNPQVITLQDMWWKDMKMRLIIGLAVSVVLAFTVFSIVQAVRRSKAKAQIQMNAQAMAPPSIAVGVEKADS